MTDHSADGDILFSPVSLGAIPLSNRVVMAPLTRSRARPDGVLRPITADYYRQRATAGLIVSEATNISPEGRGYAWTPGIFSTEQVEAWRAVTDAVHGQGGRIVLQLWHTGRISHPELQPGGALPVAPSAVTPRGQAFTETGFKPHVTPRALDAAELPRILDDYRKATANALAAGFDGVEIHAANGYLLDQFLRDGANRRTDAYGGSIENRLRFPLEVVRAVAAEAGPERTGIRISPVSPANDLTDSDPEAVFTPFVGELGRLKLAYLHVVEGATGGPRDFTAFDPRKLKAVFGGAYVANNGYDRNLAVAALASGAADAVAFGKPFIANPDLVERLRRGTAFAEIDRATLYGGDEKGYLDYPTLAQAAAAA